MSELSRQNTYIHVYNNIISLQIDKYRTHSFLVTRVHSFHNRKIWSFTFLNGWRVKSNQGHIFKWPWIKRLNDRYKVFILIEHRYQMFHIKTEWVKFSIMIGLDREQHWILRMMSKGRKIEIKCISDDIRQSFITELAANVQSRPVCSSMAN